MCNEFKESKLFFDGAFGTYYSSLKGDNKYCEYANIDDGATVCNIHKEYIIAGVDAIKTNTFGANSLLKSDFELIKKIIRSAYEIATEAVKNTKSKVYADIGYINSDDEYVEDEYIKLANIFLECGAKNFIFETMEEYNCVVAVVDFIKNKEPTSNIVVSFASSQDGYTKKGKYYKDLIKLASENKNIDVVGLNCICGPNHLFNLIKELDLKGINFSAMPNSGYPSTVNGRTVYRDNAEYFSQKLADIASLGVNVIGGCCGTTPEHIKMTIDKIKSLGQAKAFNNVSHRENRDNIKIKQNNFKDKLLSGKKVVAVELDPPSNTDFSYLISAARLAQKSGADIITIADSPLARIKADSIITAAKIKREVGIDVLPHLTCRDKNHIGIKASLIGANVEAVNNVLVITGDPIAKTDRTEYKGVFSLNSFNLISYIDSLNIEVFNENPFFIGGALNINSTMFDNEIKRAKQKIANGALYLLTQPIYSDEGIENFNRAKKELDCKILAGILPIASYKNALFLDNEVSGIEIPKEIIQSLKDRTPEETRKISVDFSLGIMSRLYDFCDGFYIMTPLKRIDFVCDLIKNVRSGKG